jgi:hypothetical protein
MVQLARLSSAMKRALMEQQFCPPSQKGCPSPLLLEEPCQRHPPSHIEEPHPALLFQAVGWSKQKEVQPDVEGTNLGADAFFNNTRNFHSLDPNVSEECGLSSSL